MLKQTRGIGNVLLQYLFVDEIVTLGTLPFGLLLVLDYCIKGSSLSGIPYQSVNVMITDTLVCDMVSS